MPKLEPRPGILDITPYVGGNTDISDDQQVINLASNESALGPSPHAVTAYESVSTHLHRYPDGSSQQLRMAIAQKEGINPQQLVCGNGSERLIDLLVRAYAGPGDEVLYSQFGFLMYPICALAAGATPITAQEQNFTTSVDALLAAVTKKTRIIFIANPNNPTGTYISKQEILRLHSHLPENILLVIDSAYAEYVEAVDYSAGHELVTAKTPNVVVLHTFSKIYGLAALRLGWAYCPNNIADTLNRIRGSFNINASAQAAGLAALADQSHLDQACAHNRKWLPWLQAELQQLGLEITPGSGNFVLSHFKTAEQCQAAHAYLKQQNIVLRPMTGYRIPAALRITVGLEHENKACIDALNMFFRQG